MAKKIKKEHFEILLENINTKVEQIVEGYVVLDNKITNLDSKIDNAKKELKIDIKALSFRIDIINLRLNTLIQQPAHIL